MVTGTAIIAAIGVAVAVAGTVQQAKAAKAAGRAQQAESEFNRAVALQQADREKQVSAQEANKFGRDQSALRARARAARAGSGVVPTAGTSLLVDEDIAAEIARNKALIKAGGAARSTRLEQESALLGLQGSNASRSGSAAASSALFQGGSTALTSASQIKFK